MRDDLLDAQAAVDWAVSQFDSIERKITEWRNTTVCIAIIDEDLETREKTWEFSFPKPLPRIINAEAGAIIGSLRSSLDLLANALAVRNGHSGRKDVYFPVSDRPDRWEGEHGGAKKIKRLSEHDRAAIEQLQPYHGRDDGKLLSALHHMDVARKHSRLLSVTAKTPGIVVSRTLHGGSGVTFIPFNDCYTSAVCPADPDYDVQVRIEVTFSEASLFERGDVRPVLVKLARLTSTIIGQFDYI